MNKKNTLNYDQESILKQFINTFLPPTKNKRKYSGNELDYIHSTLDRVFIQNFGFNLSRKNVLDVFNELDYSVFALNATWDSETKVYKPKKNGESNYKIVDKTVGKEAPYTYIDISASTMRNLRKVTATLPANTNLLKYAKTEILKQNIKQFAQVRKKDFI